jgi:hypothetical protein
MPVTYLPLASSIFFEIFFCELKKNCHCGCYVDKIIFYFYQSIRYLWYMYTTLFEFDIY